jgi:glycosidase
MAKNTPHEARNLVIYEIFVRSHSPQGTFQGVTDDLPRIKDLGVDMIWLMPIHPVGSLNRKGSHGSPYSIADYFSLNPEYGELSDFTRLLDAAHALNLKIMIDVVYNHTAHDALLLQEHPDWYHSDGSGKPVSTVPEWSDVIDLDFSHTDLWSYLISALEQWARLGVDGFRCDVASLIPLDFWLQARTAIEKINPNLIWLAESVEAKWIPLRRNAGLQTSSDGELYQAFDITYDYDIFDAWKNTLSGDLDLQIYLDLLRFQDSIYPCNYVKLRFVENHDNERIMSITRSKNRALAWTAFQAFNKGAWLIYAGQESACTHLPSLFNREPIQWGDYAFSDWIKNLAGLKKHPAAARGELVWMQSRPAVLGIWYAPRSSLVGIFNLRQQSGELHTALPDGKYTDLLTNTKLTIQRGRLSIPPSAQVFECPLEQAPQSYPSLIL